MVVLVFGLNHACLVSWQLHGSSWRPRGQFSWVEMRSFSFLRAALVSLAVGFGMFSVVSFIWRSMYAISFCVRAALLWLFLNL